MAYKIVNFIFISNVIRMSASVDVYIHNKMAHAKIVPDVIPVAPDLSLLVFYPSNALVDLGNKLTPSQVKDKPVIKWREYAYRLYTLCMIDVDYQNTSSPSSRQWQHWLVGNIPENYIEKGDTLSEYIGVFPSKESGIHRYVFLVYRQPEKLNFDEPRLSNRSVAGRAEFNIIEFAEKYKLGNPDAGNFFRAQWDDYVPKLYKALDKGTDPNGVI